MFFFNNNKIAVAMLCFVLNLCLVVCMIMQAITNPLLDDKCSADTIFVFRKNCMLCAGLTSSQMPPALCQ